TTSRGRHGRRAAAVSSPREAQRLAGRNGERDVRAALARELSEDFVVLNGLTLPPAADDLDHVVVGPTGVFLLETKTMAGQIVCAPDGTWRRMKVGRGGTAYGAFIGDPAAQTQRNIFALRTCLRRRLPHLFQGTPLWIEGLVVFAHPGADLSAAASRVPAVRLDQTAAWIREHRPRRPLPPDEVSAVAAALLRERLLVTGLARTAQALVELALALPLLLLLLFGTVALSRVVQAHAAIVVVAHEVARAGALGTDQADAMRRMLRRTEQVVPGLGLDAGLLEVVPDATRFAGPEGQVRAVVRYAVDLSGLPLAGWAPPPMLSAQHVEWVDPFRAGIDATHQATR
ncbi:MAG: NERD domain-containing protein, partial [Chloroflexota bacterium]|nr:NERD domain-containing protein [Chloroflexota bacterium]